MSIANRNSPLQASLHNTPCAEVLDQLKRARQLGHMIKQMNVPSTRFDTEGDLDQVEGTRSICQEIDYQDAKSAQRQIKANNAQALARSQRAKKLRHAVNRYDDATSDKMTHKSPSRYSQISIGSKARSYVGNSSPEVRRLKEALEKQKREQQENYEQLL